MIKAWAAKAPKQKLVPYEYEPGELKADEVEIEIENCGICHSDLSIIDNEWGVSTYPAVPGHEVIGRVIGLGSDAKGLKIGQRAGIGWGAGSCMHCRECLSGDQTSAPRTCRQLSATMAVSPIACARNGRGWSGRCSAAV